MKKLLIIILLNIPFLYLIADQEKCVRGSRPYGFFADFLWALNHLEYCLENNKTPVIYWGEQFAYYSPQGYNGSYNGWEYYFEPVSQESFTSNDYIHSTEWYPKENNFSTLWWYHQYIQNKHLLPLKEQHSLKNLKGHDKEYFNSFFQKIVPYPIGKYHLYDKKFRKWVHENLITPFIKIKLPIKNKINNFYIKNIKNKKTIGIHLRGTHLGKEVLPVDLSFIFAEANKHAGSNTQFFIATDQEPLLQKAKKELKGSVIFYPCKRFKKTTSPYPGVKLDPVLGEDVLIETILLSQSNHLIHTLSNVSTAALYFNPTLEHTLIY